MRSTFNPPEALRAQRGTGRGFESRQPYQEQAPPCGVPVSGKDERRNPRPPGAKHIQSAGGWFALCANQVVGSNPVSRTKNPVSHQGYRVFELSQRDSKGAVSENVPVARFPRDPARPQAGNPVSRTKTQPSRMGWLRFE